jgi:hypothetical protein
MLVEGAGSCIVETRVPVGNIGDSVGACMRLRGGGITGGVRGGEKERVSAAGWACEGISSMSSKKASLQ